VAIDFSLKEDERLLVDAVEDFAKKEIHPALREIEEKGISEKIRKTAIEMGLLGIEFPETIGGSGLGMFQRILVSEAIAGGDAGAAYSLFIHLPYAYLISEFGDDRVKKEYLKPVISGQKKACLLRTEIYNDNVITDLNFNKSQNRVKVSGRGIVEIENPDFFLTYAKSGEKTGLFLFSLNKKNGIEISKKLIRCGAHSSPAIEINFKNAEPEVILTDDFFANPGFWRPIARIRLYISSLLLGLSKIAHEYSLKYAMERVAFGQPIAKHQAISFMIADMATRVESIRLILWKAVYEFDKNSGTDDKNLQSQIRDNVLEAFIHANEMSNLIAADAVQLLGGHGYIKDHPVEKWMRDVKDIGNSSGRIEGLLTAIESL